MGNEYVHVKLNDYYIRSFFDHLGQEPGYDDDIALEIREGNVSHSYKMNIEQALDLKQQIENAVYEMKRTQQGAQPDAFGAG